MFRLPMNALYRTVLIGWIVVLFTAGAGGEEPSAGKKKKIIEWGAEPTTSFLKVNIDKMERLPFDGVVFPLKYGNGGVDVTWKMWSPTKYEYHRLEYMVSNLTQTPFKSLTDRFIRVNVTPGNVNWFDDPAWSAVLHNFTVAAKVAKEGKCKGFMFDVEQYEDKLFSLDASVALHNASREEYQAKVKQRGREWITAVSGEFKDIIILLPWAYQQDLSEDNYSLLPMFLDGILEAAPPTVRLVDAGEVSYKFKYPAQFKKAYETVKKDVPVLSSVPDIYKKRMEAGFGIWIDADWDKIGWHQDDLNKNFFNPNDFKKSVTYALENSDEYVWIYSEKAQWWTGKQLPDKYVKALRSAKEGK